MRLPLTLAALLLAALTGACATMSAEERAAFCRNVDWREYGRNDGRLGVPADERDDLFARCAELGYPPDLAAYRAGRQEGLEAYCTLESGYEVGASGRRYRDVCPPEAEIAFLQGYEEGREEYRRQYRAYPRFGFGIGIGGFHHRHGVFGGYYPYYGW